MHCACPSSPAAACGPARHVRTRGTTPGGEAEFAPQGARVQREGPPPHAGRSRRAGRAVGQACPSSGEGRVAPGCRRPVRGVPYPLLHRAGRGASGSACRRRGPRRVAISLDATMACSGAAPLAEPDTSAASPSRTSRFAARSGCRGFRSWPAPWRSRIRPLPRRCPWGRHQPASGEASHARSSSPACGSSPPARVPAHGVVDEHGSRRDQQAGPRPSARSGPGPACDGTRHARPAGSAHRRRRGSAPWAKEFLWPGPPSTHAVPVHQLLRPASSRTPACT